MAHFWHFVKRMLRYRVTLFWAVVFAMLSAGGLGAGLMSLGPMMGLVLKTDVAGDVTGEDAAEPVGATVEGLAAKAMAYNAGGPTVAIPEWVVSMLPADRYHSVILIVVGLGILTVLGATANFLHQYLSMTVVAKTIAGVRRDCFRRVIHMPLARIVTRGPSDFVARIIRDAAELQGGLIALTSKAAAQVTKGMAAFLVALWFNWRLTFIALIVAPALAYVLRKVGKRIRRGTRGSLAAQEDLLRIASESLRGVRAVKASTGERTAAARFHHRNKQVVMQELRVRLARSLSGPLVETIAIFVIGALALIAAREIIEGDLAFNDFLLAIGSLAVAGSSFKPLTGLINEMQAASAPASRLLEILDEPRESSRDAQRPAMPRHRQSIEFRDVAFRYEGAEKPAIDHLSLTVAFGERVAIVGPNGCGKSTLLAMVPRLLRPTSGAVLIDGVDVQSYNLRSVRRQIGVVTQETVLFRGTVAENICFGAQHCTREQVINAARQAHADEFIRLLPDGYDTILAEQGASLSGGQCQRLAIARAILRDPSIMILDEATSQIDSESESLINRAISEFCQGRTALLIAHRLSTVLSADRIVVMDAGRIVDQGSHAALMARCELYQRLARHQLLGGEEPPTSGPLMVENVIEEPGAAMKE